MSRERRGGEGAGRLRIAQSPRCRGQLLEKGRQPWRGAFTTAPCAHHSQVDAGHRRMLVGRPVTGQPAARQQGGLCLAPGAAAQAGGTTSAARRQAEGCSRASPAGPEHKRERRLQQRRSNGDRGNGHARKRPPQWVQQRQQQQHKRRAGGIVRADHNQLHLAPQTRQRRGDQCGRSEAQDIRGQPTRQPAPAAAAGGSGRGGEER
mmetsp:Transcript_17107/g.54942  ORF Transcript_17107/g.54942 Transcript_17107/m.54942 type:complete len:206 (-) Transcript_17107:72-689(-)